MEARVISDWAIKKKILSMVIPITTENMLQMTAGLVSISMVGRISAVAVGAIGLSNVIFRLIWAAFKDISISTTIFVAQSYEEAWQGIRSGYTAVHRVCNSISGAAAWILRAGAYGIRCRT